MFWFEGEAPAAASAEESSKSLIDRIGKVRMAGLPFVAPKYPLRAVEAHSVRDVLQMLQGYPSNSFLWNEMDHRFYLKKGIHLSHLSEASFMRILHQFVHGATSLRRVEIFVTKVSKASCDTASSSVKASPTLQAFANAVLMRLESLRQAAMRKEVQAVGGGAGTTVTLLSLSESLSWVCAGAEFLDQVVNEAVPQEYFLHKNGMIPAELGAHILSYLYDKLSEFCLVHDGEEEPYRTLLVLFVGSLRPLTGLLDSWLCEGILSDPFGELFFYASSSVAIEDAAFWQHGFGLCSWNHTSTILDQLDVKSGEEILTESSGTHERVGFSIHRKAEHKDGTCGVMHSQNPKSAGLHSHQDELVCPNFLRPIAMTILSAGKSLQLLQYVRRQSMDDMDIHDIHGPLPSVSPITKHSTVTELEQKAFGYGTLPPLARVVKHASFEAVSMDEPFGFDKYFKEHQTLSKSLYDEFCQSLKKLLAKSSTQSVLTNDRDGVPHTMRLLTSPCLNSSQGREKQEPVSDDSCFRNSGEENPQSLQEVDVLRDISISNCWSLPASKCISSMHLLSDMGPACGDKQSPNLDCVGAKVGKHEKDVSLSLKDLLPFSSTRLDPFGTGRTVWEHSLNLKRLYSLPALNDESLREAVFTDSDSVSSSGQTMESTTLDFGKDTGICSGIGECTVGCGSDCQKLNSASISEPKGTDYGDGLGCGHLLMRHAKMDSKAMEQLFPYPTILPFFKEGIPISELLPAQRHQRVAPMILDWLQKAEIRTTLLPAVLVQECLMSFIQKQVDAIGKQVLNRLMGEWKLMEELAVLRAVYLIGSGDLLQQFCSVLFGKLDRGEPWDDFYELNTMLQESVRSSADGVLLPTLDSLVVTVQPQSSSVAAQGPSSAPLHVSRRGLTFGIDTLDSLFFVCKVPWPLELIIDNTAIKKYNQVMAFLLKVKRAKSALDKACRWMWKNGGDSSSLKQQLLLQQKLMHFVNTLHQYVMDRVLLSAWVELCEGMASAGSLDEVITCHDTYLVSIQRQCLVAPDKLWALIAGRVKTILWLALDFYSIQRTLCGGGAAPAIKARCQLEIDRVGRQFDECIVFLLRVLSFKLNVGHFPHLADLVTRINYNYYYISESGHLLTPLPEISSGRANQGRLSGRIQQ